MVAAPKTAMAIEAERLVKEFPDTPSRVLAKRLAKEYKATMNAAVLMIRRKRGAQGKANRSLATTDRKHGKSGWKPTMPGSLAEDWQPFVLDAKRIASLSDIHIPFHSEVAFHSAVKSVKAMKPDCLLLNGDYADFYSLSRFIKDPTKRDFKTEVHLLRQGLEWLRHEFPKVRIVWKLGNHEERWQHWLWDHAPEICELEQVGLEQICQAEKHGVEIVDDQRPIMAGKLPILHGHELGKGISSPVNPARGAFMRAHHSVLVGHHHKTSGHSEPNMWHDEVFVWSQGCLCDLSPEYAKFNKWNWGFGIIDVHPGGEFEVHNRRMSKDGVVRAS